ncbi:serine hydrolase [uncultured Lacinutrix sp.]|uniref:serine hydrolase domain-containing protein n=1 Tax=uncultured Lacinutrix sp. TaxID=574032 RepID=UPI0026031892|nr:serine hydrolase domain-containing protein [uncultured Lacinutrix sp.]
MKKIYTAFLLLVMTISFSQETQKRQITTDQIDAVFSQWNTKDKPGIAVGILNNGKIVHAKGYGLANLEHQVPINQETKFYIGDLAKEFTVYALLLLEQRELLSLQDDIRKHMPKLTSLPHSISIQQLINHTSGLNNDQISKALAGWKTEDVFTKEQAYKMIWSQSKFISNRDAIQLPTDAGFMILEDLITNISKMPYTNFVTKEIFKPLGMTNSVFDTQGTVIANKAQGYFAQKDSFTNSTINHRQTIVSNVYTTIRDMCFWARELESPKVGTKRMIEKFDELSIVNNKKVDETNTALYTGGHRFWNFRGVKKLYHVEVAGGYASKLIRYPDYSLAVIVMGNDGAYNGYAATGASALYIEDFLDQMNEESTKITSKKLSKKQLSAFEGDYWDIDNYTKRKIHVVNDTLRYYRGPGNESSLVPITNKSFKMITRGDVMVNFDSNAVHKTMLVKVGDNTSHLISYNKNANWSKDLESFTGNYYAAALNTSYSLSIDQDKLILTHPRFEPVQLDPTITDLFTGNKRHFSSLAFKRNTNGTIQGFKMSAHGITDIWFQKQTTTNENLVKTK